MQVVILAGGLGTRLRPVTRKIPKCMISIHGKPFLEHQLLLLRKYQLRDIVLCLGHLANIIKSYFGDGSQWEINICYSVEEKLLGTGGALKKVQPYLKDCFLVLNGDTYLPINYQHFISHFYQLNKQGLIAVYNNQERVAPNNIALNQSNMVIKYNKESRAGMDYVDAGAIILRKEVLDLIPKNRVISLEEEIYPKLIKMKQLPAYPISQRYYDIGSPQRLALIKEVLK